MRTALTSRAGKLAALSAAVLILSAASLPKATREPDFAPVVDSLADLRAQLKIPGLAAAIAVDGQIVWRGHWGNLDTKTPRNVASLTKTMAAVIALQQVQQGRLSLQDPVAGLPGVEVRHLLSHTSVGRPGENFAYNNARYGSLATILEQSARENFPQLLRSHVFDPAGMTSTQPGKSSSSGVVSNVEDLVRYAAALDGDRLLGDRQKQWMWMPIGPGLPYALGWFSQSYGGRRVVWHYGQLIGYGSSLIVKLPALHATLVVLSNSSALPDKCQFESGDLTKSALGRSFLSAIVDHLPIEPHTTPNTLSSIAEGGFASLPQLAATEGERAKTAQSPQPAVPQSHPAAGRTAAAHLAKETPPAHSGF